MGRKLDKITVKYGAAFIAVAAALIVVVIADQMLVQKLSNRMADFNKAFGVASSALLNADRDLYQARVASMQYVTLTPGSDAARQARQDHDDNAQQALDRAQRAKTLLMAWPEAIAPLQGFESTYDKWKAQSAKVFALHKNGDAKAAREKLDGSALDSFSNLRHAYDETEASIKDTVIALARETRTNIRHERTVVLVFSVIVAVFAVTIALFGPLMISRAIRDVTRRMQDIITGDGDLTARIHTKRGDEIGELAEHVNAVMEHIDQTLQKVRSSTSSVSTAANQIASGSQDLASRTEQSAANLQQTSSAMEQITATVKNSAESANQGEQLARTSMQAAQQGEQSMHELAGTMDAISQSTGKISAITTMIDSIAFQTNLLALNASVEAARAGEDGRGFAVVAQEVRNLAGQAGDAARDIRALIDTSVERTEVGVALTRQTGERIGDITKVVQRISEVINDISTGAREQSQGITEINTAISELDNATQNNSSLVEETSTAARHMRNQADQLNALVASFKLSDTDTSDATRPALPSA